MTVATTEQTYVSVAIDRLPTASVLGVDLYIRHLGGEPLLYRSNELPFTEENRARLIEGGIEEVLIPSGQREALEELLAKGDWRPVGGEAPEEDRQLTEIVLDAARPLERRCETLLDAAHRAVRETLDDLSLPGAPERLGRVAETTARFLLEEPRAYSRLVKMFRLDLAAYSHSTHTSVYALDLARAHGIDDVEVLAGIGRGALLHDVGANELPIDAAHREAALSDLEWAELMTHPERGVALLEKHGFDDAVGLDICRSHHERWDGSGYTQGLVGKQIPVAARIVAIADAFDALTSRAESRQPSTGFEALSLMRGEHAGRFDPVLLDLFIQGMTDRGDV